MSAPPGKSRAAMLKVLVLAPGRSGTTSVETILRDLCRANGCDWVVKHQTEQGPLTKAAADAILRGDTQMAREILGGWSHDIEVSGNQNAFLVPTFRKVFGDDLKIIRLRREPEAHLRSLLTGPKVSPEVWGGYHDASSDYDGPIYWQPPTAIWFGEMTEGEWNQLTTEERVRWYLETLQTWMDRGADTFAQRIDIRTEELNDPGTIERIANFLNPTWTERVEPVHKNRRSMFDYSKLSVAQAKEARRLWEKFDFHRSLGEPAYLLTWVIDKTLEIAGDPVDFLRELEVYAQDLRANLDGAMGEIRGLKRRIEINPADSASYCRLMEVYLRIGAIEDVLGIATPWIALNSADARGWELLIDAAERSEDASLAREWRVRAKELVSP